MPDSNHVQTPAPLPIEARLFQFLYEFVKLRTTIVREVSRYEAAFWFNDLPRNASAVYAHALDGQQDGKPWLSIDKIAPLPVPRPPEICIGWFDPATLKDFSREPQLFTEPIAVIPVEDGLDRKGSDGPVETAPRTLEDAPEITEAWEVYLAAAEGWRSWQKIMQRDELIRRCYRKLFAMFQQQERRGEQCELVVGVGTLFWMTPTGHRVQRPILTHRATLSLEKGTGRLELNVSGSATHVVLEDEMIEASDRPPTVWGELINAKAAALDSIWDRPSVINLMREWFDLLPAAADDHFSDRFSFDGGPESFPQMAFAPVLILRKRHGHAILEALDSARKAIMNGLPPANLIKKLCSANRPVNFGGGHPLTTTQPQDILFPLLSNDEQEDIVHQLDHHSCVVVQGPPGTGKSHTIVNLVCQFLSQNKRILVTSQTPRALRVLKDKFPDNLRPLVVSVLDENVQSQNSIQQSVQGILKILNDSKFSTENLQMQITQLNSDRRNTLAKISALKNKQRDIREKATIYHSVPRTNYRGTAEKIAIRVRTECDKYSWFEDDVRGASVPLTPEESLEFVKLDGEVGPQVHRLCQYQLPTQNDFPQPDEMKKSIEQLLAAQCAVANGINEQTAKLVRRLMSLEDRVLTQVESKCKQWVEVWVSIVAQNSWLERVRKDLTSGDEAVWHTLRDITHETLEELKCVDPSFLSVDPERPEHFSCRQLQADAEDLLKHITAGRTFGFWHIRPFVVRRTRHIWEATRFNGRLCQDKATLGLLIEFLRISNCLETAEKVWPSKVLAPKGTVRQRAAALKERFTQLEQSFSLCDIEKEIVAPLANLMELPPRPLPATAVNSIQNLLRKVRIQGDENRALQSFLQLERQIGNVKSSYPNQFNQYECFKAILNAVQQKDPVAYQTAIADLVSLRERQKKAYRYAQLQGLVEAAAPMLGAQLRDMPDRCVFAESITTLQEAWAWKTAQEWLEQFNNRDDAEQVAREIHNMELEFREQTSQLVEKSAWSCCLQRLNDSPDKISAIEAWALTVSRLVGKGTGKNVHQYLRDARQHLEKCWDAIPAHIMPLHRVAEQFSFNDPEMFDVVIVDESSQTGPEGLLLMSLAKQCIIVGDDKQISPESGFVNKDAVNAHRNHLIQDLPFGNLLQPGISLFDLSKVYFRGRQTLREHFRCMPEIIRFSNDLCYTNTPLIPLRQYSAGRLPPLMDRFVNDGYREGSSQKVINRMEAAALVKTLIECLQNPAYKGKSFGVICLQGQAQSQVIESMLFEKLGSEPFSDPEVRLLCGDPYSFQGDERNVIFLSMVTSLQGATKTTALSAERFKQRFNVAASRACDQLWLFRSVHSADLSPNCMRRSLIEFMRTNPSILSPRVDLDSTTTAARQQRNRGTAPAPFDSWFEVDVFLALTGKGYRVIPQWEVAGRRIDLVVEDSQVRAAVECDGDTWHGPERFDEDSARQRILERAGWKFIRIRSSTFYANPEGALELLIGSLTELRVSPWRPNDVAADNELVDYKEVSGSEAAQWLDSGKIDSFVPAEDDFAIQVNDEPEDS
jgi:very-short-patch-repair endonuclease